jgi:Cys-tRNA(Pro)/Cys-tRNA(Cys) deacylase
MAKKRRSGSTPAVQVLQRAGVRFTEHPYVHDPDHPSYGLEAAEALGVDPDSVFKTLLAQVDGALVVAVLPVTATLNLKSLATATGGKRATLAEPALAERTTGYVVGGISPLGQRKSLPTVVDTSATTLDTLYVSGGRRGLDVGLAPADLIRLTQATTAPLCAPAR